MTLDAPPILLPSTPNCWEYRHWLCPEEQYFFLFTIFHSCVCVGGWTGHFFCSRWCYLSVQTALFTYKWVQQLKQPHAHVQQLMLDAGQRALVPSLWNLLLFSGFSGFSDFSGFQSLYSSPCATPVASSWPDRFKGNRLPKVTLHVSWRMCEPLQ